jgi:chemotaxis protein MotB
MTQRSAPPVRVRKKPNHERWLVSYADLLTLLLALFIVLFATSTQDKLKLMAFAEGLQQVFHGTPQPVVVNRAAGRGIMPHQIAPVPRQTDHPAPHEPRLPPAISHALQAEILALQSARTRLYGILQPLTDQKLVTMTAQPLTLTISFDASTLFPTGQAVLLPPAIALLGKVAAGLTKLPPAFRIVVQGYTDDQPIATAAFPSNWALSSARAVSVVQLFIAAGIAGPRLSVQGFGQYAPFADNTSAAGRAQNRRVVVIIQAADSDGK